MPSVRLSEAELADLKARAEAAGLSIGGYVRLRCLEQPPEPASRRALPHVHELRRLLAQLGRIGGNVYQIARALNFQEGIPTPAVLDEIAEDLATMKTALMKALGREP
jgi:hypothetical protein